MKVIFLDIDGVLNSRAYDRTRDWSKQTDIDETRLPLVKSIVDATDARIVLSSTWRVHWNKSSEKCDEDGRYINEVFNRFGLRVYDKTPYLGLQAARRDEIAKWLLDCDETVESFVIIDDERYDWEQFSDKVVVTEPVFRKGLEIEHAEKAIELLNKIRNS